jgi:hypothetical protein
MTERGLPIVDGAPACPFVAFDDDRDERAASPDHRHRCYAEPEPAPRALAHQEAYCLSSAFPVCPTFQDWARREAARSRNQERPLDSIAALAAEPTPQRNPPRNWAAPPPWSSRDARGQEALWDDDGGSGDELVTGDPGPPRPGRGLSGSFADRVASGPGPSASDTAMDRDAGPDQPSERPSAPPPPLAPPPVARPPVPTPAPAASYEDDDEAEWDDEPPAGQLAPEAAVRRRRERDPGRAAALAGGGRGEARGGGGGMEQRPRRDARAPEWERARPMEAYPTLRSRRLSELSVPPLLVGVVALAIAAAVLFALPGLLGFGNPSAQGSPTPSTPLVTQLISQAPTPIPAPTDQIYLVQAGDTMSRIAGRFGLTLEELIAANAENIPNPDQLQIGDAVIIPAKDPNELPAASVIPGAT